jgi:hypothetical protein
MFMKTRKMRLAWHIAHMGVKRGACRTFVVSQEGRDHWKDLDVGTRAFESYEIDRIDLIQNRDQWKDFVNTSVSLRVPQFVGIFLYS